MIPTLNQSGVLPPFLPNVGPTQSAAMAPYKATLTEIFHHFSSSPERKAILSGLLKYRQQLHSAGIVNGFQWIDGSFMEDCEKNRSRPPNDIDIVTFAQRPASCSDLVTWRTFVQQNTHLFDRSVIKNTHSCDAFYVDLALPSNVIVSHSRFFFGLFSHQRTTYLWKGLLEVPLQADDAHASAMLGGHNHAS